MGHDARYGIQDIFLLPQGCDRFEKPFGIRVQRPVEQAEDICFLHELTGVHYIYVVADLRDHAQVVADEEDAGP